MKRIAILLLVISCIVVLVSCKNDEQSLPPKPEGTVLEFWITENVENVDFADYDEIYGWMGAREYLGKGYKSLIDENGEQHYPNEYVSYIISAYPDYADGGSYITGITIADPNVEVYGVSIDSSLEDFDQIFSEMGYEISVAAGSAENAHRAQKDGIVFVFSHRRSITIRAQVSNREGIQF
ncbi:MAG: hypothetical protein J6K03_08465 [Oscillospiraceae bacterium]|nr:hypothetical protein [Oscillospiraceae bacterium]